MRDSRNDLHSDDFWEMIAIVALLLYGITFIGFMICVWTIEYTTTLTRILGLFFGFFVYIYTASLITICLMCIVNMVRSIRDDGFTKIKGWVIAISIIFFTAAILIFEFLFWGIAIHNGLLLILIIPSVIVCIPCAIFLGRFVAGEIEG